MSLTRSRLQQLHDDRFHHVGVTPGGARPPVRRWLTEDRQVPGRWPVALGGAWLVVFSVAVAVEPTPPSPDAPEPLWASLLFFAFLTTLAVAAGGLARRQRLGLVASAAAGGLALLATVMCPVSGHHPEVGAWWYVQMAGFTGLVTASVAGLRRSRRPVPSTTPSFE